MYIKWNKRGVRVCFALIGGVCVSLPLLKCSAVRAAAADLDSYMLTVPQTLGLYGDSLQAVYFDGAATTPVQFDYIGSTADISALSGYPSSGGNTYLADWSMQGYINFTPAMFQAYTYLIYKWDVNNIASSAGSSFSIKLEQSLNISAYGFKTSLFFGTSRASVLTPYNYGQYTFYGDDLQTVIGDATLMDNPYGQSAWGILRTIPRPVTDAIHGNYIFANEVAMSFSGAFAFLGHTTDGYDPLTIGSSYFATKDEGTVAAFETYTSGGYTFYDSAVYLLLQCPILYGDYIIPEPETPEGVDLSQIEEYLEQQGIDIANISEESTVQTRQLIAMLAKLEQIYQKIPSVDLSVPALSTAPNIPIDSDIDSRIMSDLDSYEMPDIDESLDLEKISSFSEFIMSYTRIIPVEIIGASAFLLFFSFVMWIIFRGRGS